MEALLNFLPLLLLLICPISMMFMHKGHGIQTEQLKEEVATLKNLVKER